MSSQETPIDYKVSLVGSSDSGKTSLVKFLKGMNFQEEDHSQITEGSARYQETWGIAVNIIEWEYHREETQTKKIRFGFWESGGAFLKKFPFFNQYLLKNSNLVVYMVSLTQDESIIERLSQLIQ